MSSRLIILLNFGNESCPMNTTIHAPVIRDRWHQLCLYGGVAALLTALVMPVQVAVFIIWPPPLGGSAVDWFDLFQMNALVGLIDLDLLLVLDNALLIALVLALYVVLRRANPSLMLLAVVASLFAAAMYIASNPAVEMLALSNRYAVADATERAVLAAAGEALVAGWQGTAFQVAYLLGSFSGIAIGVVMLQSRVFGRAAGYMGVLANAVGLGLYVPVVGVYIAVFSVLFLEIWYILVGIGLVRIGWNGDTGEF